MTRPSSRCERARRASTASPGWPPHGKGSVVIVQPPLFSPVAADDSLAAAKPEQASAETLQDEPTDVLALVWITNVRPAAGAASSLDRRTVRCLSGASAKSF